MPPPWRSSTSAPSRPVGGSGPARPTPELGSPSQGDRPLQRLQLDGASNPPYESLWAAGGLNQNYYWLGPELAAAWMEVRGDGVNLPVASPDAIDPGFPLDQEDLAPTTSQP